MLKNVSKRILIIFIVLVIVSRFVTGQFSLCGLRPFYVVTGSMEPIIPSHSLVLGKAVKASDVRVGDIVVYRKKTDIPLLSVCIIHRIIGKTHDGGYIFKGDANESQDKNVVYPDQIMFKVEGR